MVIVPRGEWGSSQSDPPGGPIGKVPLVIIHHSWRPHVEATAGTDAEERAMRGMQDYHVRQRGWDDIGYQFCIFQSGRVYEGRGWGRSGAHTKGMNSKSLGVCFVIDGNNHLPSQAAWNSAYDLIQEGVRLGHIEADYAVDGHRDYQSKDCPGHRVYPLIEEKLEGSRPSEPEPEEPEMELTKEDIREVLREELTLWPGVAAISVDEGQSKTLVCNTDGAVWLSTSTNSKVHYRFVSPDGGEQESETREFGLGGFNLDPPKKRYILHVFVESGGPVTVQSFGPALT